eukprot:Gb_18171 [translate_table: standard]
MTRIRRVFNEPRDFTWLRCGGGFVRCAKRTGASPGHGDSYRQCVVICRWIDHSGEGEGAYTTLWKTIMANANIDANPQSDSIPINHGIPPMLSDHKNILQSDALYEYILQTSVYPREAEPLRDLRKLTANHLGNIMATPAEQGQFLMLLLKLINAKRTMEIGVFTGYSLLCTALALPDDGKIVAVDINTQDYDLGRPIIEKAGVAHKIDFRETPALPLLDDMIKNEESRGSFDFIFVDADKENYLNYHKCLIHLVKIGGVIGYDNTLWCGTVAAPPEAQLPEVFRLCRDNIMEFNKAIAGDRSVEISQVPIGDGFTLCRRIA